MHLYMSVSLSATCCGVLVVIMTPFILEWRHYPGGGRVKCRCGPPPPRTKWVFESRKISGMSLHTPEAKAKPELLKGCHKAACLCVCVNDWKVRK